MTIVKAIRPILIGTLLILHPQQTSAENLITDARWAYLADTVMGGISVGKAEVTSSGSETGIRLSGRVSTENNGGFIQIRTPINSSLLKEKTGVEMRVKGSGEIYYIHLRNGASRLPWHYYQASFITKETWDTIRLPFRDFKRSSSLLPRSLNQETLRTLGVVAYGRDHQADITVSSVDFY